MILFNFYAKAKCITLKHFSDVWLLIDYVMILQCNFFYYSENQYIVSMEL